jgi:hypothetical protein
MIVRNKPSMPVLSGTRRPFKTGIASTNMRKSTLVLSSTLVVLCVCILVLFANRAKRSLRGQINLAPMSEGSALELLPNPMNPSSGKNLPITLPPPKLKLDIGQGEINPPLPDSVSELASGRLGFLDSLIKSQEPDPMWANDMMNAVHAAYEGLEGVSIDSLECGKTLCRLEIGTTIDDFGIQQAKTGLAKVAIARGEAFTSTGPPMPPRLIVYMARENTTLPLLVENPVAP